IANRREPLSLGNSLSVRREHLESFSNGTGTLHVEHVITRPISGVHAVKVSLDETWHNCAATQVDDLGTGRRGSALRTAADRVETAISDCDSISNRLASVHDLGTAVIYCSRDGSCDRCAQYRL